jgi:hypothetical protein
VSGSAESGRRPYVVEIRAAVSEDDRGDIDSWVQLLDRLGSLRRGREALLAMPSVAEDSLPEGGREVLLRWVGVHAEDAAGALQQVMGAFVGLAGLMQLSPQRVRCDAYEER